jgi:hypothetical protein
MAPFRNFLSRRSAAPNGGEIENIHEDNRVSTESHHSNPLSIRKSYEKEPPEYKLSGMLSFSQQSLAPYESRRF